MFRFDGILKAGFTRLGRQVGLTPGYFIVVPVLLALVALTGLQRFEYEHDHEELYTPTNGRWKVERKAFEEHFQPNYSDYHPSRISRLGKYGQVIIEAKNQGTILREEIFNQVLIVDELISKIAFYDEHEGRNFTYADLCAMKDGRCWDNGFLAVGNYMRQIEAGDMKLTYPIWFDAHTFESYMVPSALGGISLEENNSTVASANAINLMYFLNSSTEQTEAAEWEVAFIDVLLSNAPKLNGILVHPFVSETKNIEGEKPFSRIVPILAVNIGAMVAFCIIGCMVPDWVISKPALGLVGILSTMMATQAALGICFYLGLPFISISLAVPFLMLGIGVDNSYIMLAAWRQTSPHMTVPEQMAKAYGDSAVSITITTATNMISFFIGMSTQFRCIQIFCAFAGVSVLFTYIMQVTLVGACMALAGYAEKGNRHSVTCFKVLPRSLSEFKGFWYRMMCSGGINQEASNESDSSENAVMAFFRDDFARVINKLEAKIAILVVFVAYLGTAGWAISNLEEGLMLKNAVAHDSYVAGYETSLDYNFGTYPFLVNVFVYGHLDYSNKSVQDDMERIMVALENHPNIDPTYSDSWLRDFLKFVEVNQHYESLDISSEENFVGTFVTKYVNEESKYAKDVHISVNGSIIASRFLIQAKDLYSFNDKKYFTIEIREIVDAVQSYDVQVFYHQFPFFDQYIDTMPTTIQCVGIAAAVMMVIIFTFIPNIMCSIWVAFSVLSIEFGVIGLMAIWNVKLDVVSMTNLIMCIGFSVDFSAHISYHFMSNKSPSNNDKVAESLYTLGSPICLGASTTILAVLGLAFAPSYMLTTFFKMVFLVIVLGMLHALFLLPVLLSLFGPGACSRKNN